jgi:translation initiation factor IF-1
MSISSAIKTAFGNWKPTRLFFKKLSLAMFLAWFVFHPGYISCSGIFPSYVRVHFFHGRPDNTVQVLDARTKQPIVGAYVNMTWLNERMFATEPILTNELVTDAKGRFQPYRWIERGDMVIVEVWKPGYSQNRVVIDENDFDIKSIPPVLTLDPWSTVDNALQHTGGGGIGTRLSRESSEYLEKLWELKRKGIDDISQLNLGGELR